MSSKHQDQEGREGWERGGKGRWGGNERKEQTAKTNAIKQIRFFLLKSFNERASSLIEAR